MYGHLAITLVYLHVYTRAYPTNQHASSSLYPNNQVTEAEVFIFKAVGPYDILFCSNIYFLDQENMQTSLERIFKTKQLGSCLGETSSVWKAEEYVELKGPILPSEMPSFFIHKFKVMGTLPTDQVHH